VAKVYPAAIIGSRSLVKRRAERNINVYIVVITAKLHEAGTREHTFGAGLEKDQNRRQIAFPLPCPMFTILCPRGKHQGLLSLLLFKGFAAMQFPSETMTELVMPFGKYLMHSTR